MSDPSVSESSDPESDYFNDEEQKQNMAKKLSLHKLLESQELSQVEEYKEEEEIQEYPEDKKTTTLFDIVFWPCSKINQMLDSLVAESIINDDLESFLYSSGDEQNVNADFGRMTKAEKDEYIFVLL